MNLWLWQQGVIAAGSGRSWASWCPGYRWAQQFPESADIVRKYLKENK